MSRNVLSRHLALERRNDDEVGSSPMMEMTWQKEVTSLSIFPLLYYDSRRYGEQFNPCLQVSYAIWREGFSNPYIYEKEKSYVSPHNSPFIVFSSFSYFYVLMSDLWYESEDWWEKIRSKRRGEKKKFCNLQLREEIETHQGREKFSWLLCFPPVSQSVSLSL